MTTSLIMKTLSCLFAGLFMLVTCSPFAGAQTTVEVTTLVKETRAAIEKNAAGTFKSILAGEAPYKNENNPSLYVFILDTDLNVVAHAVQPQRAGTNVKGKPDIRGKMFRDEMLAIALQDGSGWVDYYYLNPATREETRKHSYFELANGSDGKQYIVGSGKYYGDE
jgi:polar amino acid transport system substrate-binding protein